MTAASRIRALLADGGRVHMPGVFDAASARLAAAAGFEVLFLSGFAVSTARLGLPDIGYLTPTEMAQATREVCGAVDLPVVVDADTGYGNALSAARTARELFRAGAAGLFLEDQVWPKRCGHMEGKRVVDRGEWLAKLCAVRGLQAEGVDLFVVARTDAREAVSLDEAVERARAAASVGVDAVFVEAPVHTDEMLRVAREVPDIVRVANMVEGGRTPLLTPAELDELGCRMVVTPLTGLLAATRAMRDAFATLRAEGTMRDRLDTLAGFTEVTDLVDLPGHRAREGRASDETGRT